MCSMKTDAMNNRDITNTGTGPLQKKKSLYKMPPVQANLSFTFPHVHNQVMVFSSIAFTVLIVHIYLRTSWLTL